MSKGAASPGSGSSSNDHALAPDTLPSSLQTNSMIAAMKHRIFEMTFNASGGGADDGARQRDLPAPTPRQVQNHEEGHRRIDERADAHAGRNPVGGRGRRRRGSLGLSKLDKRVGAR